MDGLSANAGLTPLGRCSRLTEIPYLTLLKVLSSRGVYPLLSNLSINVTYEDYLNMAQMPVPFGGSTFEYDVSKNAHTALCSKKAQRPQD